MNFGNVDFFRLARREPFFEEGAGLFRPAALQKRRATLSERKKSTFP